MPGLRRPPWSSGRTRTVKARCRGSPVGLMEATRPAKGTRGRPPPVRVTGFPGTTRAASTSSTCRATSTASETRVSRGACGPYQGPGEARRWATTPSRGARTVASRCWAWAALRVARA